MTSCLIVMVNIKNDPAQFYLFVCWFVCLFDFCHKSDLSYKLNILGPLCLWQCFRWGFPK